MKAPQLDTQNPNVRLIEPDIERDALLGLKWLEGEIGRNTLSLMGVTEKDNHDTSLDKERERVKGFIEKDDQLNWMIQVDEKVIGSLWVDLRPTEYLPAPAIHIMIGDLSARGQGIGSASTGAVIDYLKQQGETAVYSRTLIDNHVAAELLKEKGFQQVGNAYADSDGLEWQNVKMELA